LSQAPTVPRGQATSSKTTTKMTDDDVEKMLNRLKAD
jgi:hypothetical protein